MNILQPEYPPSVRNIETTDEAATPSETFQSILGFFRRRYWVIVLATGIAIAMGLFMSSTTPSSYTSHATMIIDTKKVQLFQQQSMVNDMPMMRAWSRPKSRY